MNLQNRSTGEFFESAFFSEFTPSLNTHDIRPQVHYNYDDAPDALVSPRLLSDASQSTAIAYTYKPYGESESTVTDSDASVNRYRFTGREYETGYMNFYRSRYYNNRMARFFSKDRWQGDLNRPLSINKYLYVEGNPIGATDPSGYCKVTVGRDAGEMYWWGYAICQVNSSPPIDYQPCGALAAHWKMGLPNEWWCFDELKESNAAARYGCVSAGGGWSTTRECYNLYYNRCKRPWKHFVCGCETCRRTGSFYIEDEEYLEEVGESTIRQWCATYHETEYEGWPKQPEPDTLQFVINPQIPDIGILLP